MNLAKIKIAILYDFDKTLSTTDMQEYEFIKNLGLTPQEFWGKTAKITEENGMDRILSYMYLMVDECKKKGIKLTREYLQECGRKVILYRGVSSWFERINQYAESIDAQVEHYIISSGITEIIEGTPIAKYFKKIYGCKFMYDANGEAIWPAMAVNFTLKTQYIFRISKGVLDVMDDANLNRHQAEKRIEYYNMIYIGDGQTDVPSMRVIKDKGGKTIALYPSGKVDNVKNLVDDNRTDYVCVADYSAGSSLEKMVKMTIEIMTLKEQLKNKEEKQKLTFKKLNENNED